VIDDNDLRYFHEPSRSGATTLVDIDNRINSYKVSWGTPNINRALTPIAPGDLVSVLARPGMGKTTLLLSVAKQANEALLQSGNPGYIVYATWETLVSEFVALRLSGQTGYTLEDIGRGNADLGVIKKAIAGSIRDRIAVVGRSNQGKLPKLADVQSALGYLQSEGKPCVLLLVDYLQRIPASNPRMDRQQQVTENLELLKDMALEMRLPILVAAQASRSVDSYGGIKMPTMGDSQWSSSIEQTSDKVLALSMPFRHLGLAMVEDGDQKYEVRSNTLVMKVLKQRWASAGQQLWMNIDHKHAVLSDAPSAPAYDF
jgi:replicative DNA helicase